MTDGPLTTIVVDYGGVLSTPLAPAFAAVQAELELPADSLDVAMSAMETARAVHPLHELETGALPEPEFFALLGSQLTTELGRPVDLADFSDRYWAVLKPNHGLIEHLRGVRRAGYRMGLLTNNVLEWAPHWRAMLPVEELFDDVVDSAVVGMRKPDPRIYALTAERLGVDPGEIVFLDDLESNCVAARDAGWSAIRFEETTQVARELDALLAARGAPPLDSPPDPG